MQQRQRDSADVRTCGRTGEETTSMGHLHNETTFYRPSSGNYNAIRGYSVTSRCVIRIGTMILARWDDCISLAYIVVKYNCLACGLVSWVVVCGGLSVALV